uniref:Putative homing endonuclease n=1 Tax=viral metagenome TaxID=1070528 RepID=A0A6M3KEH4_9ZZZZ
MPKLGEITHGKDIGRKPGEWNRKYIYVQCPTCLKERYVAYRPTTSGNYSRCQSCCGKASNNSGALPHGRGSESPHWKGGTYLHKSGYINLWISEDSPYYPMATHKRQGGGTIFEHRLIMAQSLGRCLTRQEHVHHLNGIKEDNRLENLELISPSNHTLYDKMCAHCQLRQEVKMLRATIARMKV